MALMAHLAIGRGAIIGRLTADKNTLDVSCCVVGYAGMKYASLPNWDRGQAMVPAPSESAWTTNAMSESEDSSRSGSDKNQMM